MRVQMEFIFIVEIIGTVAFAVSGALAAIEKDLDHYGICFLAIITAVGGGIIRDVLIDKDLPVALADPVYVIVSLVSAIVTIFFYSRVRRHRNLLQYVDAVGLAAFTAIGAEAAIRSGIELPFVIMTLAVLTGTGGGILRDVFIREIPFVFRKEVYAVASIAGSLVYIGTLNFQGTAAALYATFVVTLIIRMISIKKDLHLKRVSRNGTTS
jgi:uncharacterized membrane protein YeiH